MLANMKSKQAVHEEDELVLLATEKTLHRHHRAPWAGLLLLRGGRKI